MGKKAISEALKWQIVGLSKDKVNSMRKIEKLVWESEKCVRTTLSNFKSSGSVKDKRRTGRPEVTTDREKSFISRNVVRVGKMSLRKSATEFRSSLNKRISYSTIRRVLNSKGVISKLAIKKPFLSIVDRKKRLKWCRERKN